MIASPHNNFVLVEPAKAITQTSSGLDIPEEQRKMVTAPGAGIVIAVGPEASEALVGMDIYFDKYKGVEVEKEGVKYISIAETDIHGTFPR